MKCNIFTSLFLGNRICNFQEPKLKGKIYFFREKLKKGSLFKFYFYFLNDLSKESLSLAFPFLKSYYKKTIYEIPINPNVDHFC